MGNQTWNFRALACLGLLLIASRSMALSPLEPANGCYLGISAPTPDLLGVNWKAALGLEPSTYSIFCEFPLNGGDQTDLDALVLRNSLIGAITLITLEPTGGLATVTQAECDKFAARCALYEGSGAKLMIRFAHEMNGFWYTAWGQQPAAYVEKYRLLADAVHAVTKQTAMVWAPNNGLGYPYQSYATVPFPELDTNSDGQFNTLDDPYSPYYPGDDAVDWVGMSIYHWGDDSSYKNVLPADREFSNLLTGYSGAASPNFYTRYCDPEVSLHKKPLIVPESSALFVAGGPGPDSNFTIKQGWWQQLFNTSGQTANALDISASFPMLKMVVWFSYQKDETRAGATVPVDWRLTGAGAESIAASFSQYIQVQRAAKTWLAGLTEFTATSYFISLARVPAAIPATGAFIVPLTISSPTEADLIVDLVEEDAPGHFAFVGGTSRAQPTSIAAGTTHAAVSVSASALTSLKIGGTYYWQAFLLPPGEDWPNIHGGTPRVKVGAVVAVAPVTVPVDPTAAEYAAKLKKIEKAIKKAKKIKDPWAKAKALKKLKAQLKALKKKYGK